MMNVFVVLDTDHQRLEVLYEAMTPSEVDEMKRDIAARGGYMPIEKEKDGKPVLARVLRFRVEMVR